MRRIVLTLLALLAMNMAWAAPKPEVKRIDPTNWFVGMKDSSVQLMVYGDGIRDAQVSTDYAGVRIDSVVRLDSPNYLLVYVNLRTARPGTMRLTFSKGGGKTVVDYELKAREMPGEMRRGFTNADVLYMLMPDRFANGSVENDQVEGMNPYHVDRNKPSLRHGGDLEGIRQHLDYLDELGVTALWLTPVLENDSPDQFEFSTYHGYATTDYYKVDRRFGSNADYRRLIDEAHGRGMRVVMDMIFNHCGYEHPWVKDLPSKDWLNKSEWLEESNGRHDTRGTSYVQTNYRLSTILDPYASKIDRMETVEGWFVSGMPDLNQNNVHVMNYLTQNSIWWIETVGIDGIRMDTYPYASAEPMARWMARINEEYPNFNVVGETWFEQPAYTATWQKDSKLAEKTSNLKTVMDFSLYAAMDSARKEETTGQWRGFNRVYNSLVFDYLYPNPSSVMAFIENHDTDRFLHNGSDRQRLKQALALLLTVNRIPQLYYGTEVLMNGVKQRSDGFVRKDMIGGFPDDDRSTFTAEGRTDAENDMFNWLKTVLHWRRGNDVITEGRQIQFIPFGGVYVLVRTLAGRTVMTVVNGMEHESTLLVNRYAEVIGTATEATDVTSGRRYDLTKDISLSARDVLILEFYEADNKLGR